MQTTLTINLNGYVFNIDSDAYDTLKNYLEKVKAHLAADERDEVMHDIEARIADLFTERLNGRNVVDAADVQAIMDTLGQPEQFDIDNDESGAENAQSSEKADNSDRRKFRRLYRNPDDKMLGGVASGLAAYLGWDTLLVRILLLAALLFTSGWIIPFYLAFWVLVPEAKTAAQKLEMNGVEPNLSNIKNATQTNNEKPSNDSVSRRIGDVLMWLLKVILIVTIGFIGLGLFAAAAMILIFTFVALIGGAGVFAEIFGTSMGCAASTIMFVSLALAMLCPAVGLTALCMRLVAGPQRTPRRRWFGWTLLIVWLLSLGTFLGSAIYAATHDTFDANKLARTMMTINDELDDFDSEGIVEQRQCTPFAKIEVGSAVDVRLTQGDSCSVAIKARPDDLRRVETSVENGILNIESSASGHVVAYVCAQSYQHIEIDEAVTITCDSALTLDRLTIDASEASNVTLRGTAKFVKIIADGASNIDLTKLTAEQIDAQVDGASTVRLGAATRMTLTANEASTIKFDTATNATLNASEASTIRYQTEPTQCQKRCDSSSKIVSF